MMDEEKPVFSRKELIEMLAETLKSEDGMPIDALLRPITHYDFHAFASLVLSILRAE